MTDTPNGRGERPDVLIVEDNDDGRESLRYLLTASGLRVATAADGAEGVSQGLSLSPAAAVIDIGLPILDGLDVARELRKGLGPDLLLIAHTAWDQPGCEERAREAGFDHFLRKPCEVDELIGLLREVHPHG